MRTPARHRRIAVSGLAVLAFVLVGFNVVRYLASQEGLEASLNGVLTTRVGLAQEFGEVSDVPTPTSARQARGIPAPVTTPDGETTTSVPTAPGAGASRPAVGAGHPGERLQPDDPTTWLGRVATTYDRTLDSPEATLADTQSAEATSRRSFADAAHQPRIWRRGGSPGLHCPRSASSASRSWMSQVPRRFATSGGGPSSRSCSDR